MPRFTKPMSGRRRSRVAACAWNVERLEGRALLAAPTLAAIPDVTLLSGAPLHIPLDGADADGDALTYTVSITNPAVSYLLPTTNRSLRLSVTHASSGAGDPAFSGNMVFQLFEDRAPRTTARIIQLVNSGFYNGLTFHRVIPGFMIQGGDPLGNGTGGSGVEFDDEFHPGLQHTSSGLLSMAKSLDDTNDSQFFITAAPTRHLDFNHSIFGRLVEGDNIRNQANNVARGANDRPVSPVTITSATVFADNQNRALTLSAPNGYTGAADVTVTVSDGKGGTAVDTFKVSILADTVNNNPYLLPIPDLSTRANTPVSFQIPAADVENGVIKYLNWQTIWGNFSNNGARYLPPHQNPDAVNVDVNFDTGATTVTPTDNLAGVFPIYLGVAETLAGFDSQVVPLFVSPAAPTAVDLIDVSDTGVSTTDNLTRLNNSDAAGRLQFLVTGVLPGAVVDVFSGGTLIGSATVPAGQTSVTVTTNGSAPLANGARSITAVQTLKNHAWEVGNRSGTVNLASQSSPALNVTVDATPPQVVGQPVFHHDAVPHKLTYRFSENVGASLQPTDVQVERPGFDTPPFPAAAVSYDAATNTATFSFSGVLGNGNYRAFIYPDSVTDAAGNPLPATSVFDFWHLGGDANRDRKVNFDDLAALAQNYNSPSGKTWAQGDFNGDGAVNFDDLALLAQNYNTELAPPIEAPIAGAASVLDEESARPVFSSAPAIAPKRPQPAKRAAARVG